MRVLCVGDVCGEIGLRMAGRHLNTLKSQYEADLTVVNGENADGVGLKPEQARFLRRHGADVITLGNHTWGRRQIASALDECDGIIRPHNLAPGLPGTGVWLATMPSGRILAVVNLLGRLNCVWNADSPFSVMEQLLAQNPADYYLVDFHGEATSEKAAFAHCFDGRASAVFGTHTHVQTSDEQILPNGTGFITDVGMTGAATSILGVLPEQSVNMFLGGFPQTLRAPESGPAKLEGVVFEIDDESGTCLSVERLRIFDKLGESI